jgi:hypothetical protein
MEHNSEKCWVVKLEQKKLKNKEEPNKDTLLAMYRSATQNVSDLNAHSKKKKQVRIDPVAEELKNFEQLNVEEKEFLDNPKPKDVFSETDSDQ